MDNLAAPCYGGMTFHVDNSIVADIPMGMLNLHNGRFRVCQSNAIETFCPKSSLVLQDTELVSEASVTIVIQSVVTQN